MELTPIKARGKRRRGNHNTTITPILNKKLKAKSKSNRRKLPKDKPAPEEKKPDLEHMPLEILEQIFFLSENVNLPRASHRIGKILSGYSTKREAFISGFKFYWDVYLKLEGLFYHDNFDPDNHEFQSSLLAYSWANIQFILECWDMHYQRRKQAVPGFIGTLQCSCSDGNVIKRPSDGFRDHYAEFSQIEHVNQHNYQSLFQNMRPHYHTRLHDRTRIPDSLLTSPLDDEGLKKLFWLVRSNIELSPDQTWEVTLQAFQHATPSCSRLNFTAVRLLDNMSTFTTWPLHILLEELKRLESLASALEESFINLDPGTPSLPTQPDKRRDMIGLVYIRAIIDNFCCYRRTIHGK
ncbi:hypothetical protein F4804DRAFT_317787 [Jackrogersella minutella]|nr:hypothetical protein F4804DRAFT_317787 [Jackrogersella minutella]